jgi:hypothetical protein
MEKIAAWLVHLGQKIPRESFAFETIPSFEAWQNWTWLESLHEVNSTETLSQALKVYWNSQQYNLNLIKNGQWAQVPWYDYVINMFILGFLSLLFQPMISSGKQSISDNWQYIKTTIVRVQDIVAGDEQAMGALEQKIQVLHQKLEQANQSRKNRWSRRVLQSGFGILKKTMQPFWNFGWKMGVPLTQNHPWMSLIVLITALKIWQKGAWSLEWAQLTPLQRHNLQSWLSWTLLLIMILFCLYVIPWINDLFELSYSDLFKMLYYRVLSTLYQYRLYFLTNHQQYQAIQNRMQQIVLTGKINKDSLDQTSAILHNSHIAATNRSGKKQPPASLDEVLCFSHLNLFGNIQEIMQCIDQFINHVRHMDKNTHPVTIDQTSNTRIENPPVDDNQKPSILEKFFNIFRNSNDTNKPAPDQLPVSDNSQYDDDHDNEEKQVDANADDNKQVRKPIEEIARFRNLVDTSLSANKIQKMKLVHEQWLSCGSILLKNIQIIRNDMTKSMSSLMDQLNNQEEWDFHVLLLLNDPVWEKLHILMDRHDLNHTAKTKECVQEICQVMQHFHSRRQTMHKFYLELCQHAQYIFKEINAWMHHHENQYITLTQLPLHDWKSIMPCVWLNYQYDLSDLWIYLENKYYSWRKHFITTLSETWTEESFGIMNRYVDNLKKMKANYDLSDQYKKNIHTIARQYFQLQQYLSTTTVNDDQLAHETPETPETPENKQAILNPTPTREQAQSRQSRTIQKLIQSAQSTPSSQLPSPSPSLSLSISPSPSPSSSL